MNSPSRARNGRFANEDPSPVQRRDATFATDKSRLAGLHRIVLHVILDRRPERQVSDGQEPRPLARHERPLRGLLPLRAIGAPSSAARDRKSTRLNSSHITISYAVFCLKKKKT